jgi:hypothetical protein
MQAVFLTLSGSTPWFTTRLPVFQKIKQLLHGQQTLDIFLVSFVYLSKISQVPLAFLRLFGENMALVSVLSFDFTSSGEREAFLRSRIRLHLWHYSYNLSK